MSATTATRRRHDAAPGAGEPELMSTAETAALLQVDRKTLRRWEAAGLLSPIRTPSGQRRYKRREVSEAAAARNRSRGAAQSAAGSLSTGDVAHMFSVEPRTVIRWADNGKIGCTRTPGGHRRFDPAEVAALGAAPAPRRPLPVWAPDLAARYQGGASVRDCAAHLGIGYEAARTTLHALGIMRGHRGTRGGAEAAR